MRKSEGGREGLVVVSAGREGGGEEAGDRGKRARLSGFVDLAHPEIMEGEGGKQHHPKRKERGGATQKQRNGKTAPHQEGEGKSSITRKGRGRKAPPSKKRRAYKEGEGKNSSKEEDTQPPLGGAAVSSSSQAVLLFLPSSFGVVPVPHQDSMV